MANIETAERWFSIMDELCRARHMTMSQLADKFGVCRRTIQRDITSITLLMPIEVKCGRNKGVYVLGNYGMDKLYLKSDETLLLTKVKNLVSEKLSLEEKNKFDYIIKTYTKPVSK